MTTFFVGLIAFQISTGMGTKFWANMDSGNPDPTLACYGRPLDDRKDLVVASRTLPCRSKVIVCSPRTGLCVGARVGDRGPYGLKRNGAFRALVDLAPATARAIKHNGYEPVVLLNVGGAP